MLQRRARMHPRPCNRKKLQLHKYYMGIVKKCQAKYRKSHLIETGFSGFAYYNLKRI